MVEDSVFYIGLSAISALTMFLLHRVFSLAGKVAKVETAIEYKNEKLDSISDKVERIDNEVDRINVTLAAIKAKLENK